MNAARAGFDVVVVGASIAGCTLSMLLGRSGLRVALVERHRHLDTHKVLCTHHIMACATPTLQRLGIDRAIEAAGGVRNGVDGYTPWGWIVPPDGVAHGYSIRRRKLDPMLRRLAANTTGVELLLGQRVVDLLGDDRGVVGVRLRGTDGTDRRVQARLTVGADGSRSTVARLSGAEQRTAPNDRFLFFAEFTGVPPPPTGRTRFWMHEPAVSYAMPNDDDVTVLATMPLKHELPRFRRDRDAALLESMRRLPDGPRLEDARRVSDVVGFTDHPLVTRDPVPAPGLALVGDAAMTSDPSQGVGCGWAFQSASMLADVVASPLLEDEPMAPRLRAYRRARKVLLGHQRVIEHEATAPRPTLLDQLMLSAAVRDATTAAHVSAFFNRTIPVTRFVTPTAVARAAKGSFRSGRGARHRPVTVGTRPDPAHDD